MDNSRIELRASLLHAIRHQASKYMHERGYADFCVVTDMRRIQRRLGLEEHDWQFDLDAGVRHLLFIAGDSKDVVVRIGNHLPIWHDHRPTIHVECRGDVWVTGPARGTFMNTLTECVEAAVTALLAEPRAEKPETPAPPQVEPAPPQPFMGAQIVSPGAAGPYRQPHSAKPEWY